MMPDNGQKEKEAQRPLRLIYNERPKERPAQGI
jgi:hypothetical protein